MSLRQKGLSYNTLSLTLCAIYHFYAMNDVIDMINRTHSTLEADPLDSELRILDWIEINWYGFQKFVDIKERWHAKLYSSY